MISTAVQPGSCSLPTTNDVVDNLVKHATNTAEDILL